MNGARARVAIAARRRPSITRAARAHTSGDSSGGGGECGDCGSNCGGNNLRNATNLREPSRAQIDCYFCDKIPLQARAHAQVWWHLH